MAREFKSIPEGYQFVIDGLAAAATFFHPPHPPIRKRGAQIGPEIPDLLAAEEAEQYLASSLFLALSLGNACRVVSVRTIGGQIRPDDFRNGLIILIIRRPVDSALDPSAPGTDLDQLFTRV